jgi:hypothetical protein
LETFGRNDGGSQRKSRRLERASLGETLEPRALFGQRVGSLLDGLFDRCIL